MCKKIVIATLRAFTLHASLFIRSFVCLFVCLFVRLFVCLFVCSSAREWTFCCVIEIIPACVTFRPRIANRVGEGSRCRGGIVNIEDYHARALLLRLKSSKVLWQPRVSTSNTPSDHTRPHTHTHIRHIHRIHARRDIRGCGDDHF